MKEFDEAIWSHFNTDGDLDTALGNRLYPGAADPLTDFPYGVHNIISGSPDWNFSDDTEDIQWQISLYSDDNSPVEVNKLFGYARALFDNATITISGWDMLRFQRVEELRLRDVEQETWAYHVTYSVWLEKLRG